MRDNGIGNCISLENVKILHTFAILNPVKEINNSLRRPRTLSIEINGEDSNTLQEEEILIQHEYLLHPERLSDYLLKVVEYIASFVTFKFQKQIKCSECVAALEGSQTTNSLSSYKSKGFLKNPYKSVTEICRETESLLRAFINILEKDQTILNKKIFDKITMIAQQKFLEKKTI